MYYFKILTDAQESISPIAQRVEALWNKLPKYEPKYDKRNGRLFGVAGSPRFGVITCAWCNGEGPHIGSYSITNGMQLTPSANYCFQM